MKITPTEIHFDGDVNLFAALTDPDMSPSLIIQTTLIYLGPALGGSGLASPLPPTKIYPREWFDLIGTDGKVFDPLIRPRKSYYVYWSERGLSIHHAKIEKLLKKQLMRILPHTNAQTVNELLTQCNEILDERWKLIRAGKSIYQNKSSRRYGIRF